MDELYVFGKATKHHEEDDLQEIAKKMLVTQVPSFLDFKTIYPFVSDDLSSVLFRAPNVLNKYAEKKFLTPTFLDNLVSTNVNNNLISSVPVFKDYLNKLEEQGLDTQKKAYLVFLLGQKNKQLLDHIAYIYPNNIDAQNILYDTVRQYSPPVGVNYDMIVSVGECLSNFDCNLTESPVFEFVETKHKENEKEQIDVFKRVDAKEWNNDIEQASWRNSILQAFKKDQGLASHYPSQKAIKQIVLSIANNNHSLLNKIMGRYQTDIIVDPNKHLDKELLYFVDYLPNNVVETICETVQAKDFYAGLRFKPDDHRTLVKLLLESYFPGNDVIISPKIYDRTQPLDEKIVQLIVEN